LLNELQAARRITADQHTAETTVTRLSRIVCIFTAASYQTKGVAWNRVVIPVFIL